MKVGISMGLAGPDAVIFMTESDITQRHGDDASADLSVFLCVL